MISLYTDGGCKPNPGIGASAAVLVNGNGRVVGTFLKVHPDTTSNAAELSAVAGAIDTLDRLGYQLDLRIVSDSNYVISNFEKRVKQAKVGKTNFANAHLWASIARTLMRNNIRILDTKWIKGHDLSLYNNHADLLCTQAIHQFQEGESPEEIQQEHLQGLFTKRFDPLYDDLDQIKELRARFCGPTAKDRYASLRLFDDGFQIGVRCCSMNSAIRLVSEALDNKVAWEIVPSYAEIASCADQDTMTYYVKITRRS